MQGKEIVIGYKTFTAIIVAIVLCILIRIIYWLCTQGLKPELSANCSQKCRYLLKKDFIYMSVIAGIIIVVLLALTFTNDKEAVNYFSFAGTLSSIILSVVAIFMTINSENESKDAKSQMDISIHRLEKTGNDISELSEKWQSTVSNLQEKLDDQKSDISETLRQLQDMYDQYKALNLKLDKAIPTYNIDYKDEKNRGWDIHKKEASDL